MVKEHDDDVIGRPGFVFKGMRRPSQDQTILEPSGMKDAFEVQKTDDMMKILIDAQRYEPEDIIVSEDQSTDVLIVSGKRRDSHTHEVMGGQEFKHSFPMPANANLKNMMKRYGTNGVLEIDIPLK